MGFKSLLVSWLGLGDRKAVSFSKGEQQGHTSAGASVKSKVVSVNKRNVSVSICYTVQGCKNRWVKNPLLKLIHCQKIRSLKHQTIHSSILKKNGLIFISLFLFLSRLHFASDRFEFSFHRPLHFLNGKKKRKKKKTLHLRWSFQKITILFPPQHTLW